MKTKECFKCSKEKELTEFYKHPDMPDGRVNKCKECNKLDVRQNYSKKREYYIEYDKKRYRMSVPRIMQHKYQGIKARSTGKGTHNYSVQGMKFLTWSSFKSWWRTNSDIFQSMHKNWEKAGFPNKLAPSIDRIDNRKGYMPKNMQWMTLSENSSKHCK
jgi:hypothetical protein